MYITRVTRGSLVFRAATAISVPRASFTSIGRLSAESKSGNAPQPKILNETPPKEEDLPEDVKKHNEEMSKRADKATEHVNEGDIGKDGVSKEFWSGHQEGKENTKK